MNQHVPTKTAQERAKELAQILEAKFQYQFPGMGSVYDLTEVDEPPPWPMPAYGVKPISDALRQEVAELHQRYVTPRSTVDAFWYVVRTYDAPRVKRWLDNHPRDRAYLLELLESSQ